MGTASPLIISELYPMYGTHGVLSLAKFWNLLGFMGKSPPTGLEEARCADLRCYVMPHQLSDLLDGNIFLYRSEDALPSSLTEEKKAYLEEDAVFSLFLERELHLKPFIRSAGRSYSLLAEGRSGMFQRKDTYELFNISTIPVAAAADTVRLDPTAEVVLLPVDFFGRCREQFSWLLVDLVQVLELTLNQGFRNITLIEPLLHHVVEEALYTHPEQWAELTANRSQEDAMREICQLSMDDETFRFHEVFDVGHFRSELRGLGVQKTASFESFLKANGAIDTLFLLNAAFQPGGAWVQKLFAEPLLHCEDNSNFNRVVQVFDGREIFVKRLICLSAGTNGQDSSVELDGPKFARELLEALRHGHRLAFQLYFWSGPERHRMSLQASQMAHVPSLWRAFKFLPVLEELADDTIRGFLGGAEVPFVVAHWKWRDMSAGGLLEYFDQKKVKEMAQESMPERMHMALQECIPEEFHCANLFVMTNLPSTSAPFQELRELLGLGFTV
ncbi:unnamed protein product [Symbiodinium sp. CCMP2592]|nr:unnamed protein product [Symbiodinium sp. CCMP2592]